MTRSELISGLFNKLTVENPQLKHSDIDIAVRHILDAMTQKLGQQGRIEVRDFGCFSNRYRPSRNSRNPKTGVPVLVPEKAVPHFKAGGRLREGVNKSMEKSLKSTYWAAEQARFSKVDHTTK